MYNLLTDIIKNYENYKSIPEAINIRFIQNNFQLSKLILTYQRFKIFFTYEDFANYFYSSYNYEIISDESFPLIGNFNTYLDKLNIS